MMTRKQLQLGILFLTVFIDMLGFGIVMPLLPRYAEFLRATSWQIGVLVGIFSLAQLIVLPFWGHLSDRIGRKPVLMMSVFGTLVGYLMMGLTRSIIVMMIARAIDGIAGGNMSVIQASIVDITHLKERAQALGALGAAYGVGFIFGPALGGWASHQYGLASPMLIAAGLAFINLILILCALPETLKQKKEKKSDHPSLFMLLNHVEKKSYFPTLLTYFFFVCGFSMVLTLLALFFYHRYGLNELHVGYIYAMFGVVAIVLEGGLFGFLSRVLGNRLLSSIGAVLLMAGFFLLPLTYTLTAAIAICVIIAIGDSLLTPALPMIVSSSAKEQWQGAAFGFYQWAGCLARCFGPLVAGVTLTLSAKDMLRHYGKMAFWVASGLLLISFLCSLTIPRETAAQNTL